MATVIRFVDGVPHATETVVPQSWGQPDSPCTSEQTKFLTNTEGAEVADYFNGSVPSWGQVYRDYDPREENDNHVYFLAWVSHDQFLEQVAKRVALAAAGTWFGKKYFVVNTDDSRSPGTHWVSIVIEILPRQSRSVVAQLVPAAGAQSLRRNTLIPPLAGAAAASSPSSGSRNVVLSLSPSQTPLSGLSALIPGDALALTAVFVQNAVSFSFNLCLLVISTSVVLPVAWVDKAFLVASELARWWHWASSWAAPAVQHLAPYMPVPASWRLQASC